MFSSEHKFNDPTLETLSLLKESDFLFHPTGSRYFETANASSDYDFFTKNCEEVKKFLMINNFEPVQDVNYLGMKIEEDPDPLEYNGWPLGNPYSDEEEPPVPVKIKYTKKKVLNPNNVAEVWRKGKVDVQLVDNPDLKNAIQKILKKHCGEDGIMTTLPKVLSKAGIVNFWNMIYDVASLQTENTPIAPTTTPVTTSATSTNNPPNPPWTAEEKQKAEIKFNQEFIQQ